MSVDTDVLVLGGGPAGATASAILAQQGFKVTLIERDDFPRHHVGEALQPAAVELLDLHLGLKPVIDAAGFMRKYGALYEWGEDNERWSVLFDKNIDRDLPGLTEETLLSGPYQYTYHVERDRFDAILLDAAVARGVQKIKADALNPVIEDGVVVGLEIQEPGQEPRVIRARQVMDMSGQRCFLGRRFGLVRNAEDLRHMAIYGYFEGCGGMPNALKRHCQIVVSVPEGWVWFIPQSPTVTSVGLVTASENKFTDEEFIAVLRRANIPFEDGKLKVDRYGGGVRRARDWSYLVSRVVGPGWILAGDASGFVDPILAGGVEFAIRGACNAVLTVEKLLSGTEDDEVVREAYQAQLKLEQGAYLRLARYWYGNNRSVSGFFWEAHKMIAADGVNLETPLRAFQYLTTGRYDSDRYYKVFIEWQERKIFKQLGVDKVALKRALEEARKKIIVPSAA